LFSVLLQLLVVAAIIFKFYCMFYFTCDRFLMR